MENSFRTTPPQSETQSRTYTGKKQGRPVGLKNNPKKSLVLSRENPKSILTHIMDIPSGHDVIKALSGFAKNKRRGICIMSASGNVMNVVFRKLPMPYQPLSQTKPGITSFKGMYDIVSMSGVFLPPPAPRWASSLSVLLCGGSSCMVVGVKVIGTLMTVGPVVIVVASFSSSLYEKLSLKGHGRSGENNNATVTVAVPGPGRVLISQESGSSQTASSINGNNG